MQSVDMVAVRKGGHRAATPMEPPASPMTFLEGRPGGAMQRPASPVSHGAGASGHDISYSLLPSAIVRPEDEGSALVGRVLDMRTPPATQERKPAVDLFPPASASGGGDAVSPRSARYRSPPPPPASSAAAVSNGEAADPQEDVERLTFTILRGCAESGAADESTGLGLSMVIVPFSGGWHVVVKALNEGGTAAQDARILPGDVITHIQGEPVGQPPIMADLIARIKGKPSSSVELCLERGRNVLSSALALSRTMSSGESSLACGPPQSEGPKGETSASAETQVSNDTPPPPVKQSHGGMASISAGSIAHHMASLAAKIENTAGAGSVSDPSAAVNEAGATAANGAAGAGRGGDGTGASSPRETLEQVGMEEEQRLMQALAAETKCLHLMYQVQHKGAGKAHSVTHSSAVLPAISP